MLLGSHFVVVATSKPARNLLWQQAAATSKKYVLEYLVLASAR